MKKLIRFTITLTLAACDMIDAIKKGDEIAFEVAYNQFREKVYAYFLKKTRSAEDARDLVQTAFLKLWQYRQSLSAEYLLEQHLFHICRTVFIDFLRKKARQAKYIHSFDVIEPHAAFSYAAVSSDFDIRRQLNGVLAAMPEVRKKVFEMNKLQGYSYKEIADELSISLKAVDNNLTKALRQIRKRIGTFIIPLLSFLNF